MIRYTLVAAALATLAACGGGAEPAKAPSESIPSTPAPPEHATPAETAKAEPAPQTAPADTEKKVDTSKLAKVTKTSEGELKKGLTEKDLDAALKAVKVGAPWDKTTKDLVAKIGKPTYTMTPGRNSVEEDWVWIVTKGDQCHFNGVSRAGKVVDQKAMPGTYFKMGGAAHVAEEIRSEGAGFLHVCEGTVTAKAKE